MLPPASHGRCGRRALRRDERDRHVGIPAADRGLRAVEHLRCRCRVLADLRRGRPRRQLHVRNDAVVAILEEIRGHVHRDDVGADEHETNNEQRRHDADENVREDQLAPDAPQQAPLHQREQAPAEIAQRNDQADRRGGAECVNEGRRIDDPSDHRDQQFQQRRNEEETAGPRDGEEDRRPSDAARYLAGAPAGAAREVRPPSSDQEACACT